MHRALTDESASAVGPARIVRRGLTWAPEPLDAAMLGENIEIDHSFEAIDRVVMRE